MPVQKLTSSAHPPAPPQASVPSGWLPARPLLLRLHFFAGILVAPFLLVAATTGLACTLTPAVEHHVYATELRVPVGQHRLAVGEQVAAARAEHPEGTVSQVRLPATADGTTRVVLDVTGVPGFEDVPQDHSETVFVDPWTGDVRGALTTHGEWLPIRAWVDGLHRNLHLGEVGRLYSELAASWMWIVAGGGVVLWIGKRRRRRRNLVVVDLAQTGRRRTLSWHGTVGICATAGLLFLSATGLTWSHHAGDGIGRLRTALAWETPAVSTELGGTGTTSGGDHAGHGTSTPTEAFGTTGTGVDGVLAAARGRGLRDPLRIVPPATVDQAWTVQETGRGWPSRQDSVAVDGATGEVTDVLRFDSYPLAAKLTRWGVDAHMGLLFGWVNLAVLAALAFAVVVWGYRMWWQRRPDPARRVGVGPVARRGAWRSLPWPVAAVVLLVTVQVGLVLPVFGISLLVFLLGDVTVGAVRRRVGARGSEAVGA